MKSRRFGSTRPPAPADAATGTRDETYSNEEWRDRRLFPAEGTIPEPDPTLQGQVGPAPAFHDIALTTMGRLNMAGLRPDHDVLDIGCGVGRTARYLCDYLEPTARYAGFDIMEDLIAWCRTEITPRFPNFEFRHTPMFNSAYLPDPALEAADRFAFPYDDGSFDFAFAHSVFTHLPADAVANYLAEAYRVLRPGGILYATWFLFDTTPEGHPNPIVDAMRVDPSGDVAVRFADIPDAATGYRTGYVRDLYRSHGLSIVDPIHPGFQRMQDAVVAVRPQTE